MFFNTMFNVYNVNQYEKNHEHNKPLNIFLSFEFVYGLKIPD